MKKLLLSTLVTMSFVACDRDSDGVKNSVSPIVGTWKFAKGNVYDGKTNELLSSNVSQCISQSTVEFQNGDKLLQHFFDEINGVCKDTGIHQGTYTYNANTKILQTKTNEGTFTNTVLKLTTTELEIVSYEEDVNNDGIEDKATLLLVRVK